MIEDDIQTLVEMGAKAHKESAYNVMSYSPERCIDLGKQILTHPDFMLCSVVEKNEQIIAFLMAECCPAYFSDEKTASDLLVYVLPEHRGSRAFLLLCLDYVAWAKRQGAKIIFLSNTTGYEPEKVGKLYQQLGFEQIGGIYRMEV
jgi:GNAT superfamily N-acetyltransferase